MNKESIWSAFVLSMTIVLSVLIIWAIAESKEFDFSVTGAIGYGQAKWGSGMTPQPGGTLDKSNVIYNPSMQVKYTRWDLQPTLEFNYRWVNYDFDTAQAPTQKMEPRAWSILGGLTYDLKLFTVYGLIGYTSYDANVSLTELVQYRKCQRVKTKIVYHGENIGIDSDLFTYKIGAYKLFNVWMLKVGPELSLQGWNKRPGWSHCREGRENIVQPNVGLRVQW